MIFFVFSFLFSVVVQNQFVVVDVERVNAPRCVVFKNVGKLFHFRLGL